MNALEKHAPTASTSTPLIIGAIRGLGLNGSIGLRSRTYLVLNNVPCYGGQTIAMGCNQNLNPVTGFLSHRPKSLQHAPDPCP